MSKKCNPIDLSNIPVQCSLPEPTLDLVYNEVRAFIERAYELPTHIIIHKKHKARLIHEMNVCLDSRGADQGKWYFMGALILWNHEIFEHEVICVHDFRKRT